MTISWLLTACNSGMSLNAMLRKNQTSKIVSEKLKVSWKLSKYWYGVTCHLSAIDLRNSVCHNIWVPRQCPIVFVLISEMFGLTTLKKPLAVITHRLCSTDWDHCHKCSFSRSSYIPEFIFFPTDFLKGLFQLFFPAWLIPTGCIFCS